MPTLKDNIINILLTNKLLSQEQLDKALAIQKTKQASLRKVLIDEGFISEEDLLAVFSQHLYVPTLHLAKYKFDPNIVQLIPEHMARQSLIVPLSRIGNTLTVAIADPLNVFALDDLKSCTGCDIDIVLSPREEIVHAIDAHYAPKPASFQNIFNETVGEAMSQDAKDSVEMIGSEQIELSSAVKDSQKPPIVKMVDLMLSEALRRRASDIHLEPEYDCLRVRYRIDGSLLEAFKIPRNNQNAVLARLKIISNLDITESRIPQDGRFKVRFENREVDFRVSSLPTTFGQKFVLRALDKTNLSIGLDKLGFSERPTQVFKQAIAKPFGMILVTGPTGSGKSTTLYSVLNQLNTPEKNIVTVEDPVEYQIEGITQVQVRHEIKLDFASGLRAILRQSPDVIMIGEIRDFETADIAIKAALTGQLVLSTLHTNDAISSISRLLDMGVEPFLVSSSLVMLCAQRLCRKLCLKCRKQIDVPKDVLRNLGLDERMPVYNSYGCKYCNDTGFYGRIAILETSLIDDKIREMITKKRSIDEIKDYCIKNCGMLTLRDDAFIKVRDGVTSLEEAVRITTEE
ncbi:MAG: GspE/PulE family protein [Candidatus Omnitrophica bacterium]|jgi:type IV pilus assembly protein PilB|nr:GspE/PulE family protein [Candidatus Omnitrophota bacterium]